ncbi:MAG TPA: alpha/beta hydrolase family protein [Bacteroidota bacterium]|nr:alpha/beta hydrolase family protein [Bacteroidota bacterium]
MTGTVKLVRTSGKTITRLASFWIIAALTLQAELSAQTTARVDSFYAPSLGRIKKFSFILPPSYQNSSRYPVLYLLHGYGGGYLDWTSRTGIRQYVRALPLIVVMPDGENSWYVNAVNDPSARFEEYIVSDLPAYVQSRFSVDTTRQAIAGLSMGGNGALVLAMRHPDRFRFAGSLSGAITVPHWNADTTSQAVKYLSASLLKAYGRQPGASWDRYDVFLLFDRLAIRPSPYVYFAMGSQDGYRDFIAAHHQLIDSLRVHNIPFEYHETPGAHSWKFWDREIQPMVKKMMEIFGQQ